jgi:hypothetical protein
MIATKINVRLCDLLIVQEQRCLERNSTESARQEDQPAPLVTFVRRICEELVWTSIFSEAFVPETQCYSLTKSLRSHLFLFHHLLRHR